MTKAEEHQMGTAKGCGRRLKRPSGSDPAQGESILGSISDSGHKVSWPFWVKPPTPGRGHRSMTWQNGGQRLGRTALFPLQANNRRI
jgi:hypothetical protein